MLMNANISKYGSFVLTGISGTELNDLDKKILESVRPVGILFLKRNLDHSLPYQGWHEKFARLLEDIKKYTGREKIILSIDHEGGQVQRTPPPYTNFGAPFGYARYAAEVATAMATELKALGINLSWAPSADINTNPQNPIIGKLGRAFGTTVEEVDAATLPFSRALMESGILGCAKHFPGHGDTWSDSHLELPIVKISETEARARELLTFRALIRDGIPFVMTAHVSFPEIDPSGPATFSRKLLSDILRDELGFQGVLIADDINMKAVADKFHSHEEVAKCLNATVDMFIVGRHPTPDSDEGPIRIAQLIERAIQEGLVSQEIIDTAIARVDGVLNTISMHVPTLLDQSVFDRHAELAKRITC